MDESTLLPGTGNWTDYSLSYPSGIKCSVEASAHLLLVKSRKEKVNFSLPRR